MDLKKKNTNKQAEKIDPSAFSQLPTSAVLYLSVCLSKVGRDGKTKRKISLKKTLKLWLKLLYNSYK